MSAMKHVPVQRFQVVRETTYKTPVKKITGSDDAKAFFKKWYDDRGFDQEVFAVAVLDTKNVVKAVQLVTMGTLDAALVHPRETFRLAVHHNASSIIVSHNHPSGDPTPSREDFAVTDRLTEAGKILGIDVLDHIVVGDTCRSIRSESERFANESRRIDGATTSRNVAVFLQSTLKGDYHDCYFTTATTRTIPA